MYRETKARMKKVKNDKKKETKAKGSRLFSLLLRPEGGWSAGWDRTRWLVARQPDFLSLSHARAASLPSRSFSLCPFLFFYPSVPFSVAQFRTGASLAFALRAHSFFHLFIGYHCALSLSLSFSPLLCLSVQCFGFSFFFPQVSSSLLHPPNEGASKKFEK